MVYKRVVAIGWEVGGWMGTNHGIAACIWRSQAMIYTGRRMWERVNGFKV